MQPSAGPDLAHTRTRVVHWLGTAAALAAVVGVSMVVQPAGATATDGTAPRAGSAAPGPDPAQADYPVDCGPWEVGVISRAAADFDGDGTSETVAVVRCVTGTGTPPSGMYILTHPTDGSGTPRIAETLVDPADQYSLDDFEVRGSTISATVRSYSSDEVPRCCPDEERAVNWQWDDGQFTLRAAPVAMRA